MPAKLKAAPAAVLPLSVVACRPIAIPRSCSCRSSSIVALVIYFTAVNPLFFSASNALNIGRQSSVLLLVSLAETVVILIGSIDLSVGALVTLTGILTALTVDRLARSAADLSASRRARSSAWPTASW